MLPHAGSPGLVPDLWEFSGRWSSVTYGNSHSFPLLGFRSCVSQEGLPAAGAAGSLVLSCSFSSLFQEVL